jgi:UDPglucose 6-dehydrogenase
MRAVMSGWRARVGKHTSTRQRRVKVRFHDDEGQVLYVGGRAGALGRRRTVLADSRDAQTSCVGPLRAPTEREPRPNGSRMKSIGFRRTAGKVIGRARVPILALSLPMKRRTRKGQMDSDPAPALALAGTPDVGDIAVVGLWHLGSVAAAVWAATGRRVLAWDPDPELRSEIAAACGPVVEPGLEEALQSAVERGLLTVVDVVEQAIAEASVMHLAFDTQVGPSGRVEDPRLDDAVRAFAAAAPDGALLLVSSQLSVGTCRPWRDLLDSEERGLLLSHVPENLRLGRALDDFLHPDRLLIGADDEKSFEQAAQTLAPFSTAPMRLGLTAAEMAKHATNAYLALCIAFANDLAWLSMSAGADPNEVTAALRADPRVSPTAPLRPGTAFSGATLTRDLVALRDLGERCGRPDLFSAVIEANERHAQVALAWLEETLGSLQGARVAVAGLTYKPGTSTLRDSLPLRLVSELVVRGATVTAWDPAAEAFVAPVGLTRARSLDACVEEADALTVMTALPELAHVDWNSLRPARRLLIDGCMGVDRDAVEAAGWIYRGLALT